MTAEPPHAAPAAQVAQELESDVELGLSEEEAAARLERVGPNELVVRKRPNYAAVAGGQLADPLVGLLVAAAAVSAGIGEGLEAAVIGAIVVLNFCLGFAQEARAERAVLALRRAVDLHALVVREGLTRRVPARELVPGDVVVVGAGDRVPADARLAAGVALAVDESALTGESVPVEKDIDPVDPGAPLAERTSIVFAGTAVTRGRGQAIVVATGTAMEVGRIAALASAAKPPPTPLQRRLARLSRRLAVAGGVLTVVLAASMLAQGETLEESFLVGVAVAVAAVPEGLGAVVTIALAQGATAMARRGAIVRRLAAIETLGESTVIATDKTGTLTLNELRVTAVDPTVGREVHDVLAVAALASTGGDPIDLALVQAAQAAGVNGAARGDRVDELPFDAVRRRVTVLYAVPSGAGLLVVKGAPEVVLPRCELDDEEAARLDRVAAEWGRNGLRILAVAEREHDGETQSLEAAEERLEAVGLVGLQDPVRPAVPGAVETANGAGIDVVMVTGDHPRTAEAVAREVGITKPGEDSKVLARVEPADKLSLVERLQSRGEIVAVTGDGINDAPALRQADVGISMGRSGTEAAREASDVVLTDDDFSTIVAAVREGRRIGDNLRTFVAFLLSANAGEVLLFGVAVLAGLGAPMTVVQVLVVNLLTDGLPAIALAGDPASPGTMRRPPAQLGTILGRDLTLALGAAGLAVGFAATGAYVAGRELDAGAAQTMAFATVALAELLLVFAVRTPGPAWRGGRNDLLLLAVVASILLVGAAIYLPLGRGLTGAEALGPTELVVVLALSLVPFVAVETAKLARR